MNQIFKKKKGGGGFTGTRFFEEVPGKEGGDFFHPCNFHIKKKI